MTIEAVRSTFPPPDPFPLGLMNPFTPVGWTTGGTPIYPAQGGRNNGGSISFAVGDDDGPDPDFDDDDESDADPDDDDDDDTDEPAAARRRGQRPAQDDDGDEWTPPDRASFERLTTALKRANSEAGKRRRVGKAMDRLGIADLDTWLTERGIDPATGAPFGSDVIDPDDDADGRTDDGGYEREDDRDARTRDRQTARQILAAEQRGRAAERETMMGVLAEQSARLALRDAGFSGNARQLDRVLRTIDPRDLDLDLDGDSFELLGIEEAIEEIRTDFPEYFEDDRAKRTTRTPANGRTSRTRGARDVDGGDRGRQPKKQLTWVEQMAERMERGRR